MNPLKRIRARLSYRSSLLVGAVAGVVAVVVVVGAVDRDVVGQTWGRAVDDPAGLVLATGAFAVAFALRAIAWRRVLPSLTYGHSLAGIHLALGANHVLPFRLGEPMRIVSVVRRAGVGVEAATASTVALRGVDTLAVVALGVAVAPAAFADLVGWVGWLCIVVVAAVATLAWRWLSRIVATHDDVSRPDILSIGLSGVAWLFEAVLVHQAAGWAGLDISWSDAVLVATVAVAAQIAAIAPGGFGTYEAASVAAYVALGHDAAPALAAAIAAHGLKTAYSLVAGSIAAVTPAPSLLGRFRLRRPHAIERHAAIEPDAPVVLFMPAYNEAESVAECVARCPADVLGHRVEVIVVDDGSTDHTVDAAIAAGATVVSMGSNRGLGAAVRTGFAEGVRREAAVVAFCDADGEYPPEELANLVAPILDGTADYVCGSRFLGRIDHMHPHRRFGNIVLTRALRLVARRRITDGQTGYRALSLDAARNAEIIHDFNYAQVLTLDLLAKRYRYHEVPISYHFRVTGESFIKLGRYLRAVVPATYREINNAQAEGDTRSVDTAPLASSN